MTPGARAAGAFAAALIALAASAPHAAQTYPARPIRLIVPFPAGGGGADVVGRLVGLRLAEGLGQPVVVENRAGAAGNVGIELVAKAAPDGHTLLVTTPNITISPSLYRKLPYDTLRDLAPVALVAEVPNLVLVRPALPVKTVKEFVEYARARPGKLSFGGSGVGSSTHLATVLLLNLARIDLLHVAYKGSTQALTAMLGGEIDLVVIGPPSAMQHIQSGRVRALAVLRNERLATLPDVPTIREAGIENSEVTTWYGLLAPAGTPREIVRRLNAEWAKSAAQPETRDRLRAAGIDILASTPEAFGALIKADLARWARVIKEANITVE